MSRSNRGLTKIATELGIATNDYQLKLNEFLVAKKNLADAERLHARLSNELQVVSSETLSECELNILSLK